MVSKHLELYCYAGNIVHYNPCLSLKGDGWMIVEFEFVGPKISPKSFQIRVYPVHKSGLELSDVSMNDL
jgi:hypothetical protein